MKKKFLIIKLITGRVIERDITNDPIAPIGSPANCEEYARLCSTFCANGYTDPELVTDNNYTHIAPSQIATVSVTFK